MKFGKAALVVNLWLATLGPTYAGVALGPTPPAALRPTPSPTRAAPPTAEPDPGGLSYGADVTVVSEYVRRGERLGSAGLAAHAGFERRLSSGFALRGHLQSFVQFRGADVGEAIWDLALVSPPQPWLLGGRLLAGWTYYDRNSQPLSPAFMGHDTQEVYLGAEFDGIGRPWALLRYDYDRGDGRHNSAPGTYLCAGAGHTWRLAPELDASLHGRLGLDLGRGVDAFSDALVQSSLTLHVARGVTVSPRVDWWLPSHQLWPQAHGFRPTAALTVAYRAAF